MRQAGDLKEAASGLCRAVTLRQCPLMGQFNSKWARPCRNTSAREAHLLNMRARLVDWSHRLRRFSHLIIEHYSGRMYGQTHEKLGDRTNCVWHGVGCGCSEQRFSWRSGRRNLQPTEHNAEFG